MLYQAYAHTLYGGYYHGKVYEADSEEEALRSARTDATAFSPSQVYVRETSVREIERRAIEREESFRG